MRPLQSKLSLSFCLLFAISLSATDPARPSAGANPSSTVTFPRLLRFSGTLPPGPEVIGVTFALYADQTGGSPLWQEVQNVHPDASGSFSILLGSTQPDGLPMDLFIGNQARWLGVKVAGQEEQPRVELLSVPYALKAGDAETLNGMTSAQIAAIGQPRLAASATAADQGTLSVTPSRPGLMAVGTDSGSTPSTQLGSFYINGSQGVLEVLDHSSNPAQPLPLLINPTGGNVGIGTTTPTSALTVNGDVTASGTANANVVNATTSYEIGGSTVLSALPYDSQHVTGGNVFLGLGAGSSNSGGTFNIFVGNSAGQANTVGVTNTFIGSGTGGTTVTGSGNTFIGNTTFTGSGGSYDTYLGAAIQTPDESGTMRLGNPLNTANTYIAGVSGASVTNGVPVFADINGKMGTTGSTLGFSQVTGSLSDAQLSGSYSHAVQLTSTSNSYYGDGSHLINVAPATGSPSYIQNGQATQVLANMNIDGNGTFGKTVTAAKLAATGAVSANVFQINSNTVLAANLANGTVVLNGNSAPPIGAGDTYVGVNAGSSSSLGFNNTFVGVSAGISSSNSSNNTYVGASAGFSNSGTGNIYLGFGVDGSGESSTMRLGGGTIDSTYIAGISGITISDGVGVVIDSSGHMGTASSSSRRFKEAINPMGNASHGLFKLRPVTFYYKRNIDPTAPRILQYGLVAEELAEVYPDLVTYDVEGRPNAIKYQYLTPMLLNELQKQHSVIGKQEALIESQKEQLQAQARRIRDLEQRMERMEKMMDSIQKN